MRSSCGLTFLLTLASSVASHPTTRASTTEFAPDVLDKVIARLGEIATHSWEIGTQAEALLEWEWPELSVYGKNPLPLPILSADSSAAADVFFLVNRTVAQKPAGVAAFWSDGAAGDPASIGVAALVANWTTTTPAASLSAAIDSQLDFLLYTVPHSPEGAISHRVDQLQYWADYISMAPPFLAYYGAIHNNITLLQLAYLQAKLYRQALTPNDTSGLWQHILGGNVKSAHDEGHWGTGNAWAASGMLRILRTLAISPFASSFRSEQADLYRWSAEIIDTTWTFQQANGTLLNYVDRAPNATFVDTSATALMAASTFRLAALSSAYGLNPVSSKSFSAAIKAREVIIASVDEDGYLLDPVNPLDWNKPAGGTGASAHSPEGQAFVLMMEAAWRDLNAGS